MGIKDLKIDLSGMEAEYNKDIEYEIDDYTSLVYSIEDDIYYAYKLDIYDEEEYLAPIDINDDTDLLFNITVQDKEDFKKLISDLKEKGELNNGK